MSNLRPNGIYDIPAKEYFAIEAASNSGLKLIAKSPKQFKYAKDHPEAGDTKDRLFRRAFHASILEPDNFERDFVIVPDDAPKRPAQRQRDAKKPSVESLHAISWWDDFNAKVSGKEIVDADVLDTIRYMRDAIYKNSQARELLSVGKGEQSVFWTDSETGVQCRSRIDWHTPNYLCDLKSGPADRDGFLMIARKLRYHCQQAMYSDGIEAIGGAVDEFWFIVAEEKPPYETCCHTLGPRTVKKGREMYRNDLVTYAWCMATDSWEGYPEKMEGSEFPNWAIGQEGSE